METSSRNADENVVGIEEECTRLGLQAKELVMKIHEKYNCEPPLNFVLFLLQDDNIFGI